MEASITEGLARMGVVNSGQCDILDLMNKTGRKNVSLSDLYREVRALRRDVSVFMPTESFDDYKNKKEILAAHRDARKEIARARLA